MKIRIILSGTGGELDRQSIEVTDLHTQRESADVEISCEIIQALKCWTLAPGDTIKIVEVS